MNVVYFKDMLKASDARHGAKTPIVCAGQVENRFAMSNKTRVIIGKPHTGRTTYCLAHMSVNRFRDVEGEYIHTVATLIGPEAQADSDALVKYIDLFGYEDIMVIQDGSSMSDTSVILEDYTDDNPVMVYYKPVDLDNFDQGVVDVIKRDGCKAAYIDICLGATGPGDQTHKEEIDRYLDKVRKHIPEFDVLLFK